LALVGLSETPASLVQTLYLTQLPLTAAAMATGMVAVPVVPAVAVAGLVLTTRAALELLGRDTLAVLVELLRLLTEEEAAAALALRAQVRLFLETTPMVEMAVVVLLRQ